MSFPGLFFTNRGKALQAKALTGVKLNFTRIAVGDGNLAGQDISDLNSLIHEIKSVTINKLKILTGGKATVGGVLTNQSLSTGFYWRELALFAQDPDLGEIMYCYGNAANLAEYIPAPGGSTILEKQISINAVIGNSANVSATIDQSLIFAMQTDIPTKISQLTNDSGFITVNQLPTKTSQLLNDSNFETTSGAQNKANTAEANAKTYADNKVASLVAAAPAALDTLKELSDALGNDPNFATTVLNALSGKASNADLTNLSNSFSVHSNDNTAHGVGGKVSKSGDTLTGSFLFNGNKPINVGTWGDISVGSDGFVLIGQNCYKNKTDNKYYYSNTHATMGAKGIVFQLNSGGVYFFDTGNIATTKDVSFTPTLNRLLTKTDYDTLFQYANDGKTAVANAITAKGVSASSGDTFTALATKIGQIPTLNPISGDKIIFSEIVNKSITSGSFENGSKTMTINYSGTIRIKFKLKANSGNNYGQVFKNNVAVGVFRTASSTIAVEFTEDFACNANDQFVIKAATASAGETSGVLVDYSLCAGNVVATIS